MMTPMIESRKISSDVNHHFHPYNKIRKKEEERVKKNNKNKMKAVVLQRNEKYSITKIFDLFSFSF